MKESAATRAGSTPGRTRYQGPNIIDVGSVIKLTRAGGTPVRDNTNDELRTYYDANPPQVGEEVDLGDR
jgi:hypothetical protein